MYTHFKSVEVLPILPRSSPSLRQMSVSRLPSILPGRGSAGALIYLKALIEDRVVMLVITGLSVSIRAPPPVCRR